MKLDHLTRISFTALAAAAAITLGACKKAPEETTNNGGSGGGSGSGKPAKKENAPPSAPSSKKIAERVIGYWALDKESMIKAMEDPEADPTMAALAKPMIEMMGDMMTLEITKDGSNFYSPGEVETGTYELSDVNESAGTFTLTTIDADGTRETGKVTMKGDTMTLVKEGEPTIVVNRIDKAAFEARKEKAASFNPASLLEGLIPEGGEGGEGADIGAAIGAAIGEALKEATSGEGATPPALPPGIEIPDVPIPDEPN